MQTTPTPGLLHHLSDLLQQRAQPQPQPQVADERSPAPRKMVTAQRTAHEAVGQQRGTPVAPQGNTQSRSAAPETPTRDIPRGSFLNIVV